MGASRPLVAQMVPRLFKHYDKTSFYLDCNDKDKWLYGALKLLTPGLN